MKHCYKCQSFKSVDLFGKNKSRKDGLADECKDCKRQQDREYAAKNREVAKQRASEWYYSNYEYARKRQNKYCANWKRVNSDKHCALQNKRRADKLKATPSWLSKEQLKDIEILYTLAKETTLKTKELHHVDHIIPLRGKTVCGLHVPWNLQVIPAKENLRKSNRI